MTCWNTIPTCRCPKLTARDRTNHEVSDLAEATPLPSAKASRDTRLAATADPASKVPALTKL